MAEPSFQVSSLPIPTTFILAQAAPSICRFIYHREALQQTPGREIHDENTSPAEPASEDHQPAEPPQEASATPEDTPWLPPDTSAKYIQVQTRSWRAIHMAWTSAITPKPCRTACGLSLDNASILGQVDVSLAHCKRPACVFARGREDGPEE